MGAISYEQFEVRYGSVIPAADRERVEALLDDACAIVEDYAGVELADYDPVPAGVVTVVYNAVRRSYDNPSGLIMETVGNYSYQRADRGGAGVYITLDERRTIRRALGKMGAGEVELEGMLPAPDASQYVYEQGSSSPILYYAEEDLPA